MDGQFRKQINVLKNLKNLRYGLTDLGSSKMDTFALKEKNNLVTNFVNNLDTLNNILRSLVMSLQSCYWQILASTMLEL